MRYLLILLGQTNLVSLVVQVIARGAITNSTTRICPGRDGSIGTIISKKMPPEYAGIRDGNGRAERTKRRFECRQFWAATSFEASDTFH